VLQWGKVEPGIWRPLDFLKEIKIDKRRKYANINKGHFSRYRDRLHSVHTGSGAHPASYTKDIGGDFSLGKATVARSTN
jgi:hypothetical protein